MPAPALTWAASALLAATLSLPAFALTPGLPDTFEAGSEDGWASGAGNPSPPVAVPGGGPAGANDGYLLLSASGSPGAGGRLVAFGGPQWAGDYTQAGVTGITLDVKNLGATDLSLRLLFSSALGNAYSLTPVLVLAGSDWQPVRFDTRPAALAGVGAASLPAVTGLRLYHSPTLGEPTAAPFVAARLGLDNVTAVPEPITGHLLLAGLALLAAVRRAGVRLTKLRPAMAQQPPSTAEECTMQQHPALARLSSAALLAALAAPTWAASGLPAIGLGDIAINLQAVATGLAAPDYAISAPGDLNRLFVVEQNGLLRVIENSSLLATPALDIASRLVLNPANANDERGFLGLAFHPDFNRAGSLGYGTLYTYTSEPIAAGTQPTFAAPNNATQGYKNVVSEWKMSAANAGLVDPNSRREIVSFGKNANNHNGGTLAFGGDGYLYLGLGDGGNANDVGASHISPGGNAQNLGTPLGKMLRFDPLSPALTVGSSDAVSSNGAYRIPTTNPFQGAGEVKEIFAYGFRNPYRFSFDRGSGDLIVADVGQNNIEEVDRVVLGGNYGWAIKEGDFLFNQIAGPGGAAGSIGVRSPGNPAGLIDPITGTLGTLEYDHTDGISITGGFVYRGSAIPQLFGKYVFGDLALRNAPPRVDGRLFYADLVTGEIKEFLLPQFANNDLPNGLTVHGFGEDGNGELYALVTNTPANGSGGIVYRIAAVPEPTAWALWLAGLGLAGWVGRRRPAITPG